MANEITIKFNLTYPDLITTCNTKHTFMLRDVTQFATFGILTTDITAFKTKIDAFEALPTDTELQAIVISATASKNTFANNLRIMIRGIDQRAYLAFGNDEGKYGLFHTSNLSKLTDSELLVFGRMVKRSCDLYHTELLVYGLTALMITALDDLNDDFEDSMDTQQSAIASRDAATNNRAKKASELYNLLIRYCDTGKVIWYETNEAYYNDYVIYGTGSSGLPNKVQGFTFDFDNNIFHWTAVSNASSYEVEMSVNDIDWTNIYSGTATELYYPAQEGTLFFRCRAVNATGAGNWSDTYILGSFVSTPHIYSVTYSSSEHKTTVLWEESSAHTIIYEVWQSKVPLGLPAGTYTLIGSTPNLGYFIDNPIVDYKYYYYTIATTTGGRSGKSNVMSVEVTS